MKRALDMRSVDYKDADLTMDPGALKAFKDLGHMQAPIVTVDGVFEFSGFDPGEINRLFGASGA